MGCIMHACKSCTCLEADSLTSHAPSCAGPQLPCMVHAAPCVPACARNLIVPQAWVAGVPGRSRHPSRRGRASTGRWRPPAPGSPAAAAAAAAAPWAPPARLRAAPMFTASRAHGAWRTWRAWRGRPGARMVCGRTAALITPYEMTHSSCKHSCAWGRRLACGLLLARAWRCGARPGASGMLRVAVLGLGWQAPACQDVEERARVRIQPAQARHGAAPQLRRQVPVQTDVWLQVICLFCPVFNVESCHTQPCPQWHWQAMQDSVARSMA
jgi:hypothetical protein